MATDYSVQLNDIGAPTKGNAGELRIAAAGSEAKAIEIGGNQVAGLIEKAGSLGLSAYKGFLESGADSEIKDSVSKLEGIDSPWNKAVAGAQSAPLRQKADGTFGFLEPTTGVLSSEFPNVGPNDVRQEFANDLSRLNAASAQGTLGKDEVIARVAATIKKYSAMAPGWAAEFRKLGAENTGISNIDVYGVHKALTTQSLAEKNAAALQAASLDMLKKFSMDYGIIDVREAASPKWAYQREQWQQAHTLKQFAERAETQLKIQKFDEDKTDKIAQQIFNSNLNMEVLSVFSNKKDANGQPVPFDVRFQTLAQLNNSANPNDRIAAAREGTELYANLMLAKDKIVADIDKLASNPDGTKKTVLSEAKAKEMRERATKYITDIAESLKTVEGRNLFTTVVETNAKNKDNLLNTFYLAHPVMVTMKDLQSNPMFQAYIATMPAGGGKNKEFETRFGSAVGEAFDSLRTGKGFAGYAATTSSINQGQPVDLATVGKIDPAARTAAIATSLNALETWPSTSNPTPQLQSGWANNLKLLAKDKGGVGGINYTVKNDTAKLLGVLTKPDLPSFLGTFQSAERIAAMVPIVRDSKGAMEGMKAALDTLIAGANTPENKARGWENAEVRIEVAPETGQFSVVYPSPVYRFPVASTETAGGAYIGNSLAQAGIRNEQDITKGDSIQAKNIRQAIALVEHLNNASEIYHISAKLMNPDAVKGTVVETRQRVFRNQDPIPGLVTETATPKDSDNNAPVLNLRLDTVLDAVKFTEGGAGLSPKGALGDFQFIPSTATMYGLKIDPASGVDERKDPVKSRIAAGKLLTNLIKMWDGDLEKVAASYNAGEGVVKQAVDRAKAAGIPEQWKGVLASMGDPNKQHSYAKETIPYIKRFVEHYNKLNK